MDIVRLRIPYEFVRERTRLTWREVHFGLVNELLDPRAPVSIAIEEVIARAEPSAALLELAAAGKDDPTFDLVERLARDESQFPEEEIRGKWLFLVLAWLYEHRNEDPDPLQRVEEVHADFGYPEELSRFVRYMPMEGPDLGSREANERRMFELWNQYVNEVASRYSG